ncbi:hypothetical protein [Kineococcus terrestris]|uniref:hypothetical protein n=1 Tax=Kineococcus terrestris TaxID=2044856 RepID=UPI0034DAE1E9
MDVQEGRPVLQVVYRHPDWEFTTGARHLLDQVDDYPLDTMDDDVDPYDLGSYALAPPDPLPDPAEDLAQYEAMRLEEPLSTSGESMVPDAEGVWWWGDEPLPGDPARRGPAPGFEPSSRHRLHRGDRRLTARDWLRQARRR